MRVGSSRARTGSRLVPPVAAVAMAVSLLAAGCTTTRWGAWAVLDPPAPGQRAPYFDAQQLGCGGPAMCLALGGSDPGAIAAAWDGATWRQVADPGVGTVSSISCASSTWCAVFGSDRNVVWDGTAWSAGPPVRRFDSVDCPVPGTCLGAIVDDDDDTTDSQLYRSDGGEWAPVPGGHGLPAYARGFPTRVTPLSCSGVDTCTMALLPTATSLYRWHAGTLTELPITGPLTASVNGIDCPSDTRCEMVSVAESGGTAHPWMATSSATGVTAQELAANGAPADRYLQTIDCVDDTTCVAVGPAGTAVLDGSGWHLDPSSLFGAVGLLACPSPRHCFAGRPSGAGTVLMTWDGRTWSDVPPPPGLPTPVRARFTDVSCAAPTWCLSVGTYADGTRGRILAESFDGQRWTQLPDVPLDPDVPPSGWPRVDCATATACAVVVASGGPQAVLAWWNGTSWALTPVRPTTTPPPSAVNVDDVSCAGPTSCLAVGTVATDPPSVPTAFAVGWDGGSWSARSAPAPAPRPPSKIALSCGSPTSCLLMEGRDSGTIGMSSSVQAWDGRTWRNVGNPFALAGFTTMTTDLDCTGATSCLVGGYSVLIDLTGGCPSCDLVAPGVHHTPLVATWNGFGWTARSLPTPGNDSAVPGPLSCVSSDACLVMGSADSHSSVGPFSGDAGWVSSGTTWTTVGAATSPDLAGGPQAASCTRQICQVVGERYVHTDHATLPFAYRITATTSSTSPSSPSSR
jgi:hypothetical protein